MRKYSSELLYVKEINEIELTDSIMMWFRDDSLIKYYTNSKKKITKKILIESIRQGKVTKKNYTFGIYYKKLNLLIGTIKLGPINHKHKISDLVVLIGNKDYHGRGLAQQAIKLGNLVAFDYFDLRKLFGGMYLNNIASIKAYTRSNWIVEGILKGHYLENDLPQDRILAACFNPKYFPDKVLSKIKKSSDDFLIQNGLK